MKTFTLHVYAADRVFYEGDCVSLIVPTLDGAYGVMAHHCNAVAAVVPGKMAYTLPDGTKQIATVSDGIIKVENNDALILVETAQGISTMC